MKIAFFSEGKYWGKVPRHSNMRTDQAWMNLLDADHFPIWEFSDSIKYDIGIVIIPKNRTDIPISKIKKCCTKVAMMQEGPADYWTDYTLNDQTQYLHLLNECDFLLCHNDPYDTKYYKGLFPNKPCYAMPAVMIEPEVDKVERNGVIIGGNMCAWYNGMVSFLMATQYSDIVYAPSMGRKVTGEDRIQGLKHLPYLAWNDWIKELNKFSIGIHLMPTIAAGTFALNCSYLGIPCIGYDTVDTQRILHQRIMVPLNDLEAVSLKIKNLKDPAFYSSCSNLTKSMYDAKYHSRHFAPKMLQIFEKELS